MGELRKWTWPDSYMGASWEGYYVGLSQHRDSDALERSNFVECLDNLGGESETVFIVREGHFLVGWVEWIAIHESDKIALDSMRKMLDMLENYPVLNEEHLSQVETDEANETWQNCYNDRERLDYVKDRGSEFGEYGYRELREIVRGEWFGGYASELIYR